MFGAEGAVVCRSVTAAVDSPRLAARLALAAGVSALDPLLHLRAFLS